MDLSTRNLEQALSIRRQIDALERRFRGLVGGAGGGGATVGSRTGGRVFGRDFVDSLEIIAGKIDIERADVLLQILSPFRSGNRNDVFSLREDPRECELCGCASFFPRDFLHPFYQIEIALKIVALKSRRCLAVIVVR